MASTFTWLDTSEHERRRAMEVIDLFRCQTTRDELGIGSVRDALADLLAPGVSTIQTRAKYFLLVPWVYLRLERRHADSSVVERRARQDELRIARALARSRDSGGTIGIEAGKGLKRLPSAVYWGGLGVWGIRLFPASQDPYHRSLDRFYRAQESGSTLREDPEAQIFHGANWHPHVPEAPADFLDGSTFDLSVEEASYLQDRIQSRVGSSLMAFLVQQEEPWDHVSLPWSEPLLDRYPDGLRRVIEHARCYSELMHGAALLYNLMLAEAVPSDRGIEQYGQRLAGWHQILANRESEIRSWDQEAFWRLVDRRDARIPIPTRSFSSRWIELALDGLGSAAVDGTHDQRGLVRDRERFLKRGRARLFHREYLQMWGGASGAEQLSYRWDSAQTIAIDILRGLRGARTDADAA